MPIAKDEKVKTMRPIKNTRRLPNRSPIRVPSKSRPPNTSEYALETHDSSIGEKPNVERISAQAVVTIETSTAAIRVLTRTITRMAFWCLAALSINLACSSKTDLLVLLIEISMHHLGTDLWRIVPQCESR